MGSDKRGVEIGGPPHTTHVQRYKEMCHMFGYSHFAPFRQEQDTMIGKTILAPDFYTTRDSSLKC